MVFRGKQRGQLEREVERICVSSTHTSPVMTLFEIKTDQKQLSFPPKQALRTFKKAEDLVGKLMLDGYLTNQPWNSFINRSFIGK